MNHKEIERWYRLKNIVKACQILVLASVVLLVVWYVASRLTRDTSQDFVASEVADAGIRIENFSYSSPAPHPWQLDAASAVVSEALDKVSLSRPTVVYTSGDKGRIVLKAKTGQLNRTSQDVSAKGDVAIRYMEFLFSTDDIHYSHDTRRAETAARVSLKGPDAVVTGRGLTLLMDKREATIHEDVRAVIYNVKWVGLNGKLPM